MPAKLPRNEYPRPTMARPRWTNLNGKWRFEFDHGLSGLDEKWNEERRYSREIVVPFCPESRLSGIGDRDFHPACWYERDIVAGKLGDKRMLLHFGACDYDTTVFLNGQPLARHLGGYTPFSVDISGFAKPGKNRLTVYARDDLRSFQQPRGKQSERLESYGCHYTRTTGIWQTVWSEVVPHAYIERVASHARVDLQSACFQADIGGGASKALSIEFVVKAGGRIVARSPKISFGGTRAMGEVSIPNARKWCSADPFLYDVEVALYEGSKCVDRVTSYVGMRTVSLTDRDVLINGEPTYLALVLDQGFYPDGIYTAPTDAALKKDIELSMAAGFNGARLHQKVFEPRFLYHADRMGYLCWGESPDWGADLRDPVAQRNLAAEWAEAVRRDVMHPSIIAWTATNEQHPQSGRRDAKGEYLADLQRMIKQLDPTRPVLDNSGYWHTSTDIIDIHDYTTGDVIRKNWKKFMKSNDTKDIPDTHKPVMWPGWPVPNAPVHLSEVGGIGFVVKGAKGWGYGNVPKTPAQFMKRLADTMDAICSIGNACGYCYTQLTDVEQEINGIYTYGRKPKFDMKKVRKILSGK